MRSSLLGSCGVSVLLLLGVVGCGGGDNNTSADGGAGHKGGNGGATGKAGGGGQGAVAGSGGAAGSGAIAGNGGKAGASGAGGSSKDGGTGLDLGGITPPAMLTATVLDRRATTFELVWTAPSNSGAAVTGYQVRYAKVPITTTNFDDTTIATAVTYTGTPKAPGDTDGMIVKAYIENGYYFAVTGTDSTNAHVGAFMATAAALTAHFNAATLTSGVSTNETLGFGLNAEGDLNGDHLSDVLAATVTTGKAYMFFGSSTVTLSAPSVVFSGAATGFGVGVAQIGDIDGDGLPDIAISDPVNALAVYIYKGRTTWPMTLADTQADYVITTDSSYSGSQFGIAMARLGDFTGDGVDDLAIGARGFGGSVGRVVIIPGKKGGLPHTIALPDATNSIVIDGDATLGTSKFGYRVLGLGHFFSAATTTLIASAPGTTTSATAGSVYAFHGQTGTAGAIAISSADATLVGPTAGRIGESLSNLSAIFGGSNSVGIGNPLDLTDATGSGGVAYVMSGTPSTTPFMSKAVVSLIPGASVGTILIGGGLSGQDVKLSLIGDATPDLVLGAATSSTVLTIADGALLASKTSPVEMNSKAEVKVPLLSGSTLSEDSGSLAPDINGDGYPDFCVGDTVQPGSIVVYW